MDDMSDNLTARGEDDAEGFLDHVGVGRGRMQDMNGSVTAWNGTVWVYPWGASLYPSRYTTVEVAVITTLVTAAMMVVVVGNMLVIVAIATEKTLNSLTNWFIASLAVADLLLGLLIMPFSLANLLMGYWVFGDLWCELHAAIDVLLSTASINNICLISLDRYWSITRTVDYMKKRTPQRAIAMIVFVWVFSGLVSIPPLLGWKQTRPQDLFPKCTVSDELSYVIYSALGSFYIPSCIMIFVYIRIFYAAKARARRGLARSRPITRRGTPSAALYAHIGAGHRAGLLTKKVLVYHLRIHEDMEAANDEAKEGEGAPSKTKQQDARETWDETGKGVRHAGEGAAQPLTEPQPHGASPKGGPPHNQTANAKSGVQPAAPVPPPAAEHPRKVRPPPIRTLTKPRRELIDVGRVSTKILDLEKVKKRLARKKEKRATLILGLIMGSFIACWLPFFLLYLLVPLCPSCHIPDHGFHIAFWLGYMNSACNPVIYTIFNKDFRQAFRKILFK
ncbi:alpha-2Db adrenergic receptor-like [Portunus trituberculatus]|nr:alpha-2Db adrenergic receptor-like [Portunus trituberculatus]